MYLNYINNFRGIAILIIVAGHSLFVFNNNTTAFNVTHTLLNNGTILFVFIAGFLFQHLLYKFRFRKYIKNKILYVVLPYLIISTPIIIFIITSGLISSVMPGNEEVLSYSKYMQILTLLFNGSHLSPLWFIPMIILYYIISPILYKLDKWKYFYYLLPVLFIVSLIVPKDFQNVLQSSVNMFSVYVYGMFFSKHKEQMITFISKTIYIHIILYLVFVSIGIIFGETGLSFYIFGKEQMIHLNKLLLCNLLIYFLYKYDRVLKEKFSMYASYSFGIFFVHGYFLLIMSRILKITNFEQYYINSLLVNLLLFIIVFIIVLFGSLFSLKTTKFIFKGKSRYFIGS